MTSWPRTFLSGMRSLFRRAQLDRELDAAELHARCGKELRLAHYRGKVVLLDFWGDWCIWCMRMVPHEKDLVKRMEGKPFALVGVNSDPRERAKESVKKNGISWRSFFNGGSPGGPISWSPMITEPSSTTS